MPPCGRGLSPGRGRRARRRRGRARANIESKGRLRGPDDRRRRPAMGTFWAGGRRPGGAPARRGCFMGPMRVLCALSGGVDSAVAAAPARSGRAPKSSPSTTAPARPATTPASPASSRSCCGVDDARDARPWRRASASRSTSSTWPRRSGATSRRVRGGACRRSRRPTRASNAIGSVKFGRLREMARQLGADAVATGHYARTAPRPGGGTRLLRAVDPRKDQSYVLYGLDQGQLAIARFPLGDSRKEDVRAEARELGLGVADKPDSQELCFVPGGDHRACSPSAPRDCWPTARSWMRDGREIGRHGGAAGFTMGQRRGLGSPRRRRSTCAPSTRRPTSSPSAPRGTLLRRIVRDRAAPPRRRRSRAGSARRAVSASTSRIRHAMAPVPAWLTSRSTGSGTRRIRRAGRSRPLRDRRSSPIAATPCSPAPRSCRPKPKPAPWEPSERPRREPDETEARPKGAGRNARGGFLSHRRAFRPGSSAAARGSSGAAERFSDRLLAAPATTGGNSRRELPARRSPEGRVLEAHRPNGTHRSRPMSAVWARGGGEDRAFLRHADERTLRGNDTPRFRSTRRARAAFAT